jgi:hypothetical protein
VIDSFIQPILSLSFFYKSERIAFGAGSAGHGKHEPLMDFFGDMIYKISFCMLCVMM